MYFSHSLHMSPAQMHKLALGHSINLKHHQLCGNVPILLTASQIKRIHKNHAVNKGMRLKLSQAHLNHMYKHGSGFFSDLIRKAKDLGVRGYNAIRPTLGRLGEYTKNKLLEHGERLAKSEINDYGYRLKKQIEEHKKSPYDEIYAENKKKGEIAPGGAGFFGDLAKGFISSALGGGDIRGARPLQSHLQPALNPDFVPHVQKAAKSMRQRKIGGALF